MFLTLVFETLKDNARLNCNEGAPSLQILDTCKKNI